MAASAMKTGSSGGAGLSNCSRSGLSICGVVPLYRRLAIRPWQSQVVPGCSPTSECADGTVEHCIVSSAIRVFCLYCYAAIPGGLITS